MRGFYALTPNAKFDAGGHVGAPKRGGTVLKRIRNPAAIATLLDGRPHDPRVKYFTHVNAGRSYPHRSTRREAV